MNKCVKFGNDLTFLQQEVKSKKTNTKVVKEKTNHIWIYDRSYSMSYELPGMIDQIVELSKNLPKGDTLSLGYFSSEGEYRFIVIGFKITNKADYKFLEKTIRKNADPIGCTCFSEIINETADVIEDLSEFSKTFSFAFFTDGYPVVSNYSRELTNINSGIDKIKGQLTTAMFIGYSYYYNKPLMTKMAERIGGMLIHNDNIEDFTPTITRLVTLSETSEPKVEVTALVDKPVAVYTVTEQGVVLLNVEDGKVFVSPEAGKSSYIYYITDGTVNADDVDVDALDFSGDDSFCKGIYGGALVLCQQMATDKAMELMGLAGDKHYIDKLTNAFTIEEYGKAENKINEAINDSSARFKTGKDRNYLPPADAFCVFDLLNVLVEDDDAAFYPYDKRFKYTKISKGTEFEDGYSKFKPDVKSACRFDTLTWHKSRLNLSVLTTIKGTIELQEREGKVAKDFGLLEEYPTWVYRNYSFVTDGRPNMKVFYVTTSEETYKDLKNRGLVIDDTFKKDGTYGVHISGIPAINRAIAEGNTSGTQLCKNVYSELKLMANLKAYKYFLKEEFPAEEKEASSFSEEQRKFLTDNGIDIEKGGLYAPPVKSGIDASDFYMANRFEIKVKGCSSIPAVKKVLDKRDAGKSLTASEALLEQAVDKYEAFKKANSEDVLRKRFLENEIVANKKLLKPIRQDIQKTKFAILLAKKWFDEFTSRDETQLVVEGNTFNFKLDEEKVKI